MLEASVANTTDGISPFGSTIHATCWQDAFKFDQPLGSWNTSLVKTLVWAFRVRAPILLALAAARTTCPLSPELQQSSHHLTAFTCGRTPRYSTSRWTPGTRRQ